MFTCTLYIVSRSTETKQFIISHVHSVFINEIHYYMYKRNQHSIHIKKNIKLKIVHEESFIDHPSMLFVIYNFEENALHIFKNSP